MPRKSIKFDLDFSVKDRLPKFKVKQYDDVILNITSFNNKEVYNIEDFQVVMYIACGNDVFMQDSDIHISGNNIIINLDKNMLKKYGRALGEIEVTDEEGTIACMSFAFDIEGKIGEGATIPGGMEGFVERYNRLIEEFKAGSEAMSEAMKDNLNNIINEYEEDYNNLKKIIMDENTNANLQAQINELNEEVENTSINLQAQINRFNEEVENTNTNLQTQINKLNEDVNSVNNTVENTSTNLQAQINKLNEDIDKIGENTNAGLQGQINELHEDIEDVNKALENTSANLQSQIDELSEEVDEIKTRLESSIDSIDKAYKAADTLLSERLDAVEEITAGVGAIKSDVVKAKEDILANTTTIEENKGLIDTNAQAIAKEVQDRTQAISGLDTKITSEKERALAAEIALDKKIATANQNIETTNANIAKNATAITKEVNDRVQAVSDLDTKVNNMTPVTSATQPVGKSEGHIWIEILG